MSARRDAILLAVNEAALMLDRFATGQRSSFDIVSAISQLGVPLLFRPLDKLLGALITVDGNTRGIMVTTKRPLSVQRFTLAHELGHLVLGHGFSLDDSIDFAGRLGTTSHALTEIAANTFAAELLAPLGLMRASAKRHSWSRADLRDQANVYQLALRLGVSFQAASWALAAHRIIPRGAAEEMQGVAVRDVKRALAPQGLLEDPWADVWNLSEGDSGTVLEAGPGDIFAVSLKEMSSAGYLWSLVDPGSDSEVLDEQTRLEDEYGTPGGRTVVLRFTTPGTHRLVFAHRRPWSNETLAHIDIGIGNFGKEQGGFARQIRERALAGTAA